MTESMDKPISLDKKWKEFLYAACGFGPNLLFVLLGAYFSDAINPAGLNADKMNWSISGFCLIVPTLFPVLWMLAKIFDGLIDVPLAAFTDNLRTRWGRRRPAIVISFIPMVLGYFMVWLPLEWRENSLLNTVWMTSWLFVFFASYTMSLITFYGSLSSVCKDADQRTRVSSFKSFFDTIGYSVVYALVPVFIGMGVNISKLVIFALPLMVTMLIPLFIIKEGEKYGEGKDFLIEAKVKLTDSIKLTLKNKQFLFWLIPNATAYFGLQMFLTAQNTLVSGVMNLGAGTAAILNTCAFAPVPLMLFLYYRLIRKKGLRFAYQLCLLGFAVAIFNFCIGSEYVFPNNVTARIVVGCIGSVVGSFSIGAFFATPYMVPSQIAACEYAETGKDHTAMYFAMQALSTSVVGAAASGLVYENIKNIQIEKVINGVAVQGETWKIGVSLVPVIVCLMCIVGFLFAFKMPKNYEINPILNRDNK